MSTLICSNCKFWLLQNKLYEVFVPIKQFLALFVRILTFSVFEHCNELPISEWKELYLFNYQEKYLLTQNGVILPNITQIEVNKSLHTHGNQPEEVTENGGTEWCPWQCRQHLMQKVPRNSRWFPFKKYRSPKATAHSHSAVAKLPDLTPAPTISIPLSVRVLKSAVWRT